MEVAGVGPNRDREITRVVGKRELAQCLFTNQPSDSRCAKGQMLHERDKVVLPCLPTDRTAFHLL